MSPHNFVQLEAVITSILEEEKGIHSAHLIVVLQSVWLRPTPDNQGENQLTPCQELIFSVVFNHQRIFYGRHLITDRIVQEPLLHQLWSTRYSRKCLMETSISKEKERLF